MPSVEEYLNKIRPYLKDIIKNLGKSDTQKIQLTITNNFISSIDNDEEGVMQVIKCEKESFRKNIKTNHDN